MNGQYSIMNLIFTAMKVTELNREQLLILKQRYIMDDHWPSWGELAAADAFVSDEEIFEAYADIDFVEEDF